MPLRVPLCLLPVQDSKDIGVQDRSLSVIHVKQNTHLNKAQGWRRCGG